MIEMLFSEAVRRMVTAFEQRAAQVYGSAAIS
jgi:ribosome-associated toxin RatA of RatAB toxin-antitoxin module